MHSVDEQWIFSFNEEGEGVGSGMCLVVAEDKRNDTLAKDVTRFY